MSNSTSPDYGATMVMGADGARWEFTNIMPWIVDETAPQREILNSAFLKYYGDRDTSQYDEEMSCGVSLSPFSSHWYFFGFPNQLITEIIPQIEVMGDILLKCFDKKEATKYEPPSNTPSKEQQEKTNVRRILCHISDTAHPWVNLNTPREFADKMRAPLGEIKELCNQHIDKRGVFESE